MPTSDARATSGRYTVVYDGDCRVCARSARLLVEWDRDRRLEVVASQEPGVVERFPWIPRHAYDEALQLIAPDGSTWAGSEAIERTLNLLPKGRAFAWLYRIPFMRGVADRFYRWFARNRYRFGCSEHCPTRPARA